MSEIDLGVDYKTWLASVEGWKIVFPTRKFMVGPETVGFAGYMSFPMHMNDKWTHSVVARRYDFSSRDELFRIDKSNYFLYMMYKTEDDRYELLASESPLWYKPR